MYVCMKCICIGIHGNNILQSCVSYQCVTSKFILVITKDFNERCNEPRQQTVYNIFTGIKSVHFKFFTDGRQLNLCCKYQLHKTVIKKFNKPIQCESWVTNHGEDRILFLLSLHNIVFTLLSLLVTIPILQPST